MNSIPQVHHFSTGPFNWYLVEQDGRFTLVDAGFPGHYRIFRQGLASLGATIQDVVAIYITHAHADHTGFAERVRQESGAPIYLHEADRAKAKMMLQLPWAGLLSHAWQPYTAGMLAHATLNGIFTLPTLPCTEPVRDGLQLDIPGRPIVLHAPGHTPGQTALFLPGSQILLAGDTLVTRNLFTGKEGRPELPDSPLSVNPELARQSLTRLRNLGRVRLLPGHGSPWEGDINEAIEAASIRK